MHFHLPSFWILKSFFKSKLQIFLILASKDSYLISTLKTSKSFSTTYIPGCFSNSNGFFGVLQRASIAPSIDFLDVLVFVPVELVCVDYSDAFPTISTNFGQMDLSYFYSFTLLILQIDQHKLTILHDRWFCKSS